MINKILVPTDGSERADRAADFAMALAKATGASLLFLNVIDEVPPAYAFELESGAPIDVLAMDELRRQYGEESVNRLKEKAVADGLTATVSVVEGHPWHEILAQAKKESADHIVIGSHGRRALAAAVLGNVAVNVIHGSTIPVTVIPVRD